MSSGFQIDDLDDLSLPITPQDKRLIGRGNQIFQAPAFVGPLGTLPTLATFSTTFDDTANSNTLAKGDNDFGIHLSKLHTTTSNVNDWGAVLKAIPGGSNWTWTGLMRRRHANRTRFKAGLILRDDVNATWGTIGFFIDSSPGGIAAAKWSSDGDNLGDAQEQVMSRDWPELVYFQVQRDNGASKFFFRYSLDGDYFITLWDVPLTGSIWGGAGAGTPTQIGMGVNSNCTDPLQPCALDFLSFTEV